MSEAAETLGYTENLAQSVLLLLNGTAGMGKTHLFCDLALKERQIDWNASEYGRHVPVLMEKGLLELRLV